MKAWYTAAELAELRLPGMPGTPQGITKRAKSESWGLQRNRGVKCYAVESLPTEARLAIAERNTINAVVPAKSEKPAPMVIDAQQLPSRRREPMYARQVILEHLALQVMTLQISRLQAEEDFARLSREGKLPPHLQAALDQAHAKRGQRCGIHAATIRKWRADFAKYGEAGLVVKAKSTGGDVPLWLEPFWKLFALPGEPSVSAAYDELKEKQPAIGALLPSKRSVQRFVESLDAITKNRGRFGPREIKRFRAYIVRDFSNLKPGDIYSSDGHKADMEVQSPLTGLPMRPEIITVIDIATRRIVGWSAGIAESALLVGDALLKSVIRSGVCAIFYVDNGSGFVNRYMTDPDNGLHAALGITMINSLPYNSQSRGVIERSHQSIWVRGARFLPTFMGDDMDAEFRNRVHKMSRKEIATTGRSRTMMSWADFLVWAEDQVQRYNARPHSAFSKFFDPVTGERRHLSPNEVWQRFVDAGWQPDTAPQTALDDARRPYEERVVSRGHVSILGGKYFHERLDREGWHGRKVRVGFDLHSSDKVWVRDLDGNLLCVAQLDGNKVEYMPASAIEQAQQKKANAKLRNDERELTERKLSLGASINPHRDFVEDFAAPAEAEVIALADHREQKSVTDELFEQAPAWLRVRDAIERGETITAEEEALYRRLLAVPGFSGFLEVYEERLGLIAG